MTNQTPNITTLLADATPGEWRADNQCDHTWDADHKSPTGFKVDIYTLSEEGFVTTVGEAHGRTPKEARANAELICAAKTIPYTTINAQRERAAKAERSIFVLQAENERLRRGAIDLYQTLDVVMGSDLQGPYWDGVRHAMKQLLPIIKPTNAEQPVEQKHCRAARDGDCIWEDCPQNRDGEPRKTGRHCPLDVDEKLNPDWEASDDH